MCVSYLTVILFTSAELCDVTNSKLTQRKAISEAGEHLVLTARRLQACVIVCTHGRRTGYKENCREESQRVSCLVRYGTNEWSKTCL
jgi:hypothetical protein